MNITFSGLPVLVLQVGFVVVFSAPIWLAARVVGADHPTLLRSVVALILGTILAVVSLYFGPLALLLVPVAYLLTFKFVLGTSFGGAFLLAVLAAVGYVAMVKLVGGGMSITPHAAGI